MDATDPFNDPTVGRRYEGKVALITGAAGGIGRASAIRLAAEGATVWATDLDADGVEATAETIIGKGGEARSQGFDVTDPDAATALVESVVAEHGGLDVLCNIAGIGSMRHFEAEAVGRLEAMLAVNAVGPFVLTQAALPHLLERRGSVVNLASTAGVIGQAYCAAYCTSKHAIVGLTKALAIEFGRTGVRFNAVCPGGVNTGLIAGFAPPDDASMSLVSRQFLNRDMQEPESVAAMVAYVGSDEAHYLNGAVLTLDGGTTTG